MITAHSHAQQQAIAPASTASVAPAISVADEVQLRAAYNAYLGSSAATAFKATAWEAFKAGVAYGIGGKALVAADVRQAYAEHLTCVGDEVSRPADWDAFKAGIAHGRAVTSMAARTVCREDARAEGRRACSNGSDRRDNPYPFNSAGHVQWLMGWNEEERHDDL